MMTKPDPSKIDQALDVHIDAHWAAYSAAESAGSFEPLESFIADDLVYLAYGIDPNPICGKAAFRDLFNQGMANAPTRGYKIAFSREDTVASGDLAIDRGFANDSYTEDGVSRGDRYAYQAVFHQNPSQPWQLIQMVSFPVN